MYAANQFVLAGKRDSGRNYTTCNIITAAITFSRQNELVRRVRSFSIVFRLVLCNQWPFLYLRTHYPSGRLGQTFTVRLVIRL